MKVFGVIIWMSLSVFLVNGQESKTTPQKDPKTKIEAFEAKTGSVIIRGFSSLGSVRGQLGTSVSVESREFLEASSSRKQYGVFITVKQTSRFEREDSAYIDYDEIDSLVQGIDYISKIDKTITKLNSFQADYKTRGDFTATTFSDSYGKISAAVKSGRYSSATAYLSLEDLTQFKELIQQAKAKLDTLQK